MNLYPIARAIVSLSLKLFFKWQVYGIENIPPKGALIFIANHISNYDPPVLGCSVNRQVYFMAKEEILKAPVIGKVIEMLGSFPIKRGGNDRKAIKKGLDLLKEQKALGIFPEGTRSTSGEIGQGLPGAALFALKSNAVVIPVGIVSSYKLFSPIKVNIGQPIPLEVFKKEKLTSEDFSEAITLMMAHIKKQVDELKIK